MIHKLSCCFVRLHRSELIARAVCLRDGWFRSVGLACQNRTLTREHLHQWRIYNRGLRHLWKLLRDADSLLPPTGHFLCALDQLQNCVNDFQVSSDSCCTGFYRLPKQQTEKFRKATVRIHFGRLTFKANFLCISKLLLLLLCESPL